MEKLYTDIDYGSFPVADLTADIHWIQLALVLQVLADHLPFKGLPAQLTGKNKKSKKNFTKYTNKVEYISK